MDEEEHLNILRALVALYKTQVNTGIMLSVLIDAALPHLSSDQQQRLMGAITDRTSGVEEFAKSLEQALKKK